MKHSTALDSVVQSEAVVPADKPKGALTKAVVFASLTACLGSISFGGVIGYPSPVQQDLKDRLNWSDEQVSWFGSIPAFGAMFGVLIGLYTVDRFGRRFNIMMCSLPFVGGWLLIAAANVTSLIYIARFVTGAAVGAISFTVPMYIGEISPAKYRGALASGHQLGASTGLSLTYFLGAVLNWRWLAITSAVPGAAMALLMIKFPETPRWLIMKGKTSEACCALMYLRGTSYEECEQEAKEIERTLKIGERISLRDFKTPAIYRPFIISIALMTLRQFCGVNAVLSYAADILRDAGIENANTTEIVVAVLLTIGTVMSCLVIDKLGRRMLLIFPNLLMCVSMTVLGASRYFNGFPSSITLICLCLYIFGFALGFGPVPWVIVAEIIPNKARGFASGFTTQLARFVSFIVVKTYVNMMDLIHPYGVYWFYAAVCLVSVVFVFTFVPETKGRTLEEVEQLFVPDKRGLLDEEPRKKYGAMGM